MNSILQSEQRCFLCGANGAHDPLDTHHVFGGAYRKKSEEYGLKVLLCHRRCHIFAQGAVHQSAGQNRRLKRFAQIEAQKRYGWTEEDFIREFGKNYL